MVASLATKTGQDCNTWLSIIFPNLDQLIIPAVINVTRYGQVILQVLKLLSGKHSARKTNIY